MFLTKHKGSGSLKRALWLMALLIVLPGIHAESIAQTQQPTLPPNVHNIYISEWGYNPFTISVNSQGVYPGNANECFTADRNFYLNVRMWVTGNILRRSYSTAQTFLDPILCDDLEPHPYNITLQAFSIMYPGPAPGMDYFPAYYDDGLVVELTGYGPDYRLPIHLNYLPDFSSFQNVPAKAYDGNTVSVTATGIRAGTYYLEAIVKSGNTYTRAQVSDNFTTTGGNLTLQSFALDPSILRENSQLHVSVSRQGNKISAQGVVVFGSDFKIPFVELKAFCADSSFTATFEGAPAGTYQIALVDSATAGTVLGTLSDPVTLPAPGLLQVNSFPLRASSFPGGVLPARFTYRLLKDGVLFNDFVEKNASVSVCTGAPPAQTGQTLSFSGNGEALTVDHSNSLALNQFTVETWLRPGRTVSSPEFICSKGGTENVELHLRDSGRIRFIPAPNVFLDCPVNTLAASPGTWTHVAATYNPAIGQARLFVNGIEVPLTNNGTAPLSTPIGRNALPFVIGARNGGGFLPFAGRLDEFRLWNRALAAWEIRARMNCEIPTSAANLVLNLHFNQGAAAADNSVDPALRSALDASGYGNHATLRSFVLNYAFSNWTGTGPVVGGDSCSLPAPITVGALDFDGVDDIVLVPDRASLSPAQFTIESWVRWNRTTAIADFICSKGGFENMEIHLAAGNAIRFIPVPGVFLDAPAGSITQNVWTHIACVYNPAAGLAKMYVNGVEVPLTNNGTAPLTTVPVTNTGPWMLGRRGAFYPFAGQLNDFRLWNRVLSQSEIQSRMYCRLSDPDPALLLNLHLGGTPDTPERATDASGNTNHGTLTNFALSGTASNWVSGGSGASTVPRSLAVANATQVRVVAQQATSFGAECSDLIATVAPAGAFPINATTTGRGWIETAQPAQYVKRHFEITPAVDSETATGIVTLYFTQGEFDDFNAVNALKLPRFPDDAPGIANLRIEKRSGTSSNGSGLPETYPAGIPLTIDPADSNIVWNAAAARWEVSFEVAGFSGFFAKTSGVPLPVTLTSFTAAAQGCQIVLNWRTATEVNADRFVVQRGSDGRNFASIGTVPAANLASGATYEFTDRDASGDVYFYRLLMIDRDGSRRISRVVSRNGCARGAARLYPVPAQDYVVVEGLTPGDQLVVSDALNRELRRLKVTSSTMRISLDGVPAGMYLVTIVGRDGASTKLRFNKL